jgi:Anthrone oxygenase
MLVGFQFLAVLCCTLFAGAAIYINLVEHPARMGCDTKTAATVWAPSYERATVMQAPLAALSFLAGVGAWLFAGGILWLIGAVLIGLVIPFTFIGVMPTNHQLLAPGRDLSSIETRSLLVKWGRLHAVRSVLSLLASIVYLVSLFGS